MKGIRLLIGTGEIAHAVSQSELIEPLGMYMKLRHVERYTFDICINYCKNQSDKNSRRLRLTLQRWSRKPIPPLRAIQIPKPTHLPDCGYEAKTLEQFLIHLHYCSDRMNQGRAKALLRLLNEHENT